MLVKSQKKSMKKVVKLTTNITPKIVEVKPDIKVIEKNPILNIETEVFDRCRKVIAVPNDMFERALDYIFKQEGNINIELSII